MKKFISLVMMSTALLGAQVASAATFSPAGTWTFSGPVTVQKGAGPILNCNATVQYTVTSTDITNAVFSLAPGDLGCATVQIDSNPHGSNKVVIPPDGTIVITTNNVHADTTITPGNCGGPLDAVFHNGPSGTDWIEVDTVLPEEVTGTGDCTIIGSLDLVSPSDVTITP